MDNLPIYIDNGATSFPKPESVIKAMENAMIQEGGNPGRGSHKLSVKAAQRVFSVREKIASLFGSDHPENVVFTKNCTEALNICINGLIKSGDHFLISDIEHNSVLRPAHALTQKGASYSVYKSLAPNFIFEIEKLIRPNTKLIVACHRSNILPIELPIYDIAALCKKHGIFLVIDAAQSAGSAVIDMKRLGKCAICAPGHKGLFGPTGTGFVIFSDDVTTEEIYPLTFGGSGSASAELTMPDVFPEHLEAGTVNTVGIAGLGAGIDFVKSIGEGYIREYERELGEYCKHMLMSIPKTAVYMPNRVSVGTVLFNTANRSCEDVASFLDTKNICVRSGLHCAFLAHKLNLTQNIGAIRASFGIFNTKRDVDALFFALRSLKINFQTSHFVASAP